MKQLLERRDHRGAQRQAHAQALKQSSANAGESRRVGGCLRARLKRCGRASEAVEQGRVAGATPTTAAATSPVRLRSPARYLCLKQQCAARALGMQDAACRKCWSLWCVERCAGKLLLHTYPVSAGVQARIRPRSCTSPTRVMPCTCCRARAGCGIVSRWRCPARLHECARSAPHGCIAIRKQARSSSIGLHAPIRAH